MFLSILSIKSTRSFLQQVYTKTTCHNKVIVTMASKHINFGILISSRTRVLLQFFLLEYDFQLKLRSNNFGNITMQDCKALSRK